MVEVEKYIKRLLYEQDCVIIPEFGGLLTQYTPARFDCATGRFYPSIKKVAFNEILKVDDGLLIQCISVNEGISREAAVKCIRDFVATAVTLLRKNKVISLTSVGDFRMNEENRLQFTPVTNKNFHSDFYGFDSFEFKPLHKKKESPIVSMYQEEEVEEELVQLPTPVKATNSWASWLSAAAIAGLFVYVSAVLSVNPNVNTSTLNPFEFIKTVYQNTFEQPKIEVAKPVEKRVIEVVEPEEIVPSKEEVFVEEEVSTPELEVAPVVIEEAKEVVVAEVKALPFHVIGAVYESKSSLIKYGPMLEASMRKIGFDQFTTITKHDKYLYSIGSFASSAEAAKKLALLKHTEAKGAWIYKKN